MTMLRYANYDPFSVLRNEMDRLFDNYLSVNLPSAAYGATATPQRVSGPALNAWETEESAFIEAEVPGLTLEDLDLSVQGTELTLRGECREQAPENADYHRRERSSGKFSRVLRLPFPVEVNRVEAQLKNGILTVRLPKAESAKPRKIPVAQ